MNLQDKIALVTGGSKGIGAATAIALAQRGAHVAINGRHDDEEAAETRRRIQQLDRPCELVLGDMSLPEDARRCVEETVQKLGGVDVLIHAAGAATLGTIFDVEPEDWMKAFDVHVHAVYHLCRAAVPVMKTRKEGAIILISSGAGMRGCPGTVCYQTVKGALPQMARALARDFADDNIRVNAVAPGIIRTRFQDGMSEEAKQNNLANRIPLHREGSPEDVATLIAELVTNDFITGETVAIDGGMTMRMV